MRLIDADAIPFRNELKRLSVLDYDKYITAETLEYMLEHAPTVDAVPVIRCKDCIRWRQSKSNTTAKVCDWDRYEKTENDFCSWAKRKDDDTR